MEDNTTTLKKGIPMAVVGLMAVIAGTVAYLIWKRKNEGSNSAGITDTSTVTSAAKSTATNTASNAIVVPGITDTATTTTTASKTYTTNKFPLTDYMKGSYVKALQKMVNVTADGYLGPNTKKALLAAGVTFPISQAAYNRVINKNNWKSGKYTGLNGVGEIGSADDLLK